MDFTAYLTDKDKRIAALEESTRRLVEAANKVLSEFTAEHLNAVSMSRCGTDLSAALADPVIVALRRE